MAEYDEIKVGMQQPDLHSRIQVALANITVLEDDIKASYLGEPIVTRKRMGALNSLLNDIRSYKCADRAGIDLLIFPEVSVPHAWLQIIVKWSRQHNIGVICGLEYRLVNGAEGEKPEAHNELLAALPFKLPDQKPECMPILRLKRWYSHDERFQLENNHLSVPKIKEPYQLIRWRGSSFAIYNCYELANIKDRGLFKGKVDFIVASEWNRDTNYFSNIVGSAARDLHCYVIQVNNSKFGDSRIISPSKTEMMSPVQIKGGDNTTFLTARLDLKALRDHQREKYGLQKESSTFKPTPPGFPRKDVLMRIGLGKKAT